MRSLAHLTQATERRLWAAQDASLTAEGFTVVRLGRWGRQYRHPARLAAALARARATETAESAARATTEHARTPWPYDPAA
jgi:hypothetical protein